MSADVDFALRSWASPPPLPEKHRMWGNLRAPVYSSSCKLLRLSRGALSGQAQNECEACCDKLLWCELVEKPVFVLKWVACCDNWLLFAWGCLNTESYPIFLVRYSCLKNEPTLSFVFVWQCLSRGSPPVALWLIAVLMTSLEDVFTPLNVPAGSQRGFLVKPLHAWWDDYTDQCMQLI